MSQMELCLKGDSLWRYSKAEENVVLCGFAEKLLVSKYMRKVYPKT